MEDRSKFDWMLDWSHIAAAAFKSIFGYVCFLTFQSDTQEVPWMRVKMTVVLSPALPLRFSTS